ncbi:MAG: serine protease [Candidatus Woesearchaeota archaeon]
MGWLRNTFRKGKVLEDLASIRAMHYYVQQIYWAEDISVDESKYSIESNVVELVRYGQHSSNGLLVTTNGYFLTACHCVDGVRKLNVRHNGHEYRLEKVCAVSRENDLALAKASIDAEPEYAKYRFFNTLNPLKQMTPVVMMVYNDDSNFERRGGWLVNSCDMNNVKRHDGETIQLKDQYRIMADVQQGCSGGPVVCCDGRVAGLVSNGSMKNHIGGVAKFMKCLELVVSYRLRLENMCK